MVKTLITQNTPILTPNNDKKVRRRLEFNSDQAIAMCCENKLNMDIRKTKWKTGKRAVFLQPLWIVPLSAIHSVF